MEGREGTLTFKNRSHLAYEIKGINEKEEKDSQAGPGKKSATGRIKTPEI